MNDLESVTIGDYYTPQPKQQEFHESPARYPLAEGGRGDGKSTALVGSDQRMFARGRLPKNSESPAAVNP
jgi:hypothetical protein